MRKLYFFWESKTSSPTNIGIGLVWSKGISTIVGYLMPNHVYTYILNIWFLNAFAQSVGAVECPGYDTKQSDGEVAAVLEFWGMRITPPLLSLPGPLWFGVVASDRALSMG